MQVSLSESDIGKVKVGQPATVTVNAASGEQFAAQGDERRRALVVVLELGLERGQLPGHARSSTRRRKLKAGMSATADIVVAQASGSSCPARR